MNKRIYIGLLSATMLLVACGGSNATDADDDYSSNSTATNGKNISAEADYSVEVYESLPVCNDRKEGQTGYVAEVSKIYVCEDGEWVVMRKSSSSSSSVSEDKPVAGESSESSGANAGGSDPSTGILTDSRDGQKYKTTTIGTQVWMAQNLNYAYTGVKYNFFYTSDSSSWCYLNDADNCEKYGRLYTWSAALDSAGLVDPAGACVGGYGKACDDDGTVRGICPDGWHLPSRSEWQTLFTNVGGCDVAGRMLKSEDGWKYYLESTKGIDYYGFSVLPVGGRTLLGDFGEVGTVSSFWSSSEGYYASFFYDREKCYMDHSEHYGVGTAEGLYVRCVRNN